MKILFVINSLVGGGAERVFLDMLKQMNHDKFEIDVLVVNDEYAVHARELREVLPYKNIIRYVSKPKLLRWCFRAISICKMRYLKSASPEVLHKRYIKKEYDVEVAYLEGLSTKIVAGGNQAFKYAWIHTDMMQNPWSEVYYKENSQETKAYQEMDKVIAVSQAVKVAADKRFGICSEVRYNILDDQRIKKLATKAAQTLKKSENIVIVSVGTLWKAKGYLRLVMCIKNLLQKGYGMELYLIGDGADREILENYIKEHQLESNIHLLGFQKDPYALMCQADIYVCSSYAEGFSTSVTESLILGIPVITTECAGMREILGDSQYGLIVHNNDNALEQGIERLVTDEKLRKHYKEMAEERGKHFQIQENIEKLERMFQEDMKKKR